VSAERSGLKTACITVLGSGFAPFASGTWGSLTAVLLFVPFWLAGHFGLLPRGMVETALAAGVLVASWLSVHWGDWAIARFGRKDPKEFVLDEFAGQWVALVAMPLALDAGAAPVAAVLFGQFFLFRVFDVWKPPPARQLERLPGGLGILLDDLFAGLYANIVGQLFWWLAAPRLGLDLATLGT
jgi:phosphatidylglycerophosphatase A